MTVPSQERTEAVRLFSLAVRLFSLKVAKIPGTEM